MSVTVRDETYRGWRCTTLACGEVELVLLPQIGGRIIGLRWRGVERLFSDPAREGLVEDVASVGDVRAHKRGGGFPNWGGDKTWLGPQEDWNDEVPFLDLDSGAYSLDITLDGTAAVASMRSAVCRETGVQISRTIRLDDDATWTTDHAICNESPDPVAWAAWGVTQVLRPASVFLPVSASSRHPSGVRSFDHEGESASARGRVVSRTGGLAEIRCDEPIHFKYGVDASDVFMVGVLEHEDETLALVKRADSHEGGRYPHGCTAEVFNSGSDPYLEMELLGPIVDLPPGECTTLRERAKIVALPRPPPDEEAVRRLVHQ